MILFCFPIYYEFVRSLWPRFFLCNQKLVMMDTKSTVLVSALVMCIIYFAWCHSNSQSDRISQLLHTNQTIQTFLRSPQQLGDATNPTQPAMQMPKASEITPMPYRGHENGFMEGAVQIPLNIPEASQMAQRPPMVGGIAPSPIPSQEESPYYIGAGLGQHETHVPGDPTLPLPSQHSGGMQVPVSDAYGRPLPQYP